MRKNNRAYYFNKIAECGQDGFKLWQVLKELLNNKKKNTITKIRVNDDIISNEQEIANHLNDFFVDSITEINGLIPHRQYINNNVVLHHKLEKFTIPSDDEIEKRIMKLKNGGGAQPNSSVLKNC